MASDTNENEKKEGGQSGGFRFNASVTAQNQTFIDGNVNHLSVSQGLSGKDLKELDTLFEPLKQLTLAVPQEKRPEAEKQVQELHSELSKGPGVNTEKINKLIDGLVEMIPGAISAVISMFANPILGALVGPATKLVLDRLKP